MSDALAAAIAATLFDPLVWALVIGAAFYGTFLGALPGLTATMGVALFVPATFWLPTVPALAAIATMVACAIFAGDIPTTLIRIPGTPASAAYADDAYRLARQGGAAVVLGVALLASVIGGLIGAVALIGLGDRLANVAAAFSVAEYFWLYALGLSCAVLVGQGNVPRAFVSLCTGLLISTVGLSAAHVRPRFTFGSPELLAGIDFIPAMIGLFGLAEVFRNVMGLPQAGSGGEEEPPTVRGPLVGPAMRQLLGRPLAMVRSAAIGVIIGVLPGAGADIASWVSAAASRAAGRGRAGAGSPGTIGRERVVDNDTPDNDTPDNDTRGNQTPDNQTPDSADAAALDAISDACTANSASLAAAWIPALVFGIPGDSITAMVIGVLSMKNLKPGPEIFLKQGALVYGLYVAFILANLVLLPVGLLAIRGGGLVMRVPRRVLLPLIVLFCIVGAYAINASLFDVGLMLVFGIVGVACERFRVPVGPMVLGIILGGPLEERFVQTLSGGRGNLLAFVDRPLAAALAVAFAVAWAIGLARAGGFLRGKSVVYS